MAIQGKKKIDITEQFLYSRISEEDVFRRYMPWKFTLNVTCRNPFTMKDESPSMIIGNKSNSGDVIFKCFNSPQKGSAVTFVMELFTLSYREALEKIAWDFGLGEEKGKEGIIKMVSPTPVIAKPPVIIQVKAKPLGKEHLEYLQEFHISPNSLSFSPDMKVVAVGSWALNRAKMPLKTNEVAFAYVWKKKWVKIYRPHAKKKEKWTSNIPFKEMVGLDGMKNCEFGIITKGVKDLMFLREHITPCVCCVQAEDISAVTKENIDFLNENCKKIYVNFDADVKGVQSCQELTKATGWGYINPPKELLKDGITDFTDMGRALGVQAVQDYFKSKIKEL